jgi:ribosome recycling factor
MAKNQNNYNMDTKTILNDATARMQKAVDFLEESLANIRAGKASVNVLNGVFVDYYGSQTPVSGVASVTVPDAKTILIQPWDKNMIRPIEKAIIDSNIGLTPSNNGESIRLSMPPLTEERRKELVKQSKAEAENARISLRNARRDAVEAFKKAVKDGMPEDEGKDGEAQVQKIVEKFNKSIDASFEKKEKEIMTV